MNKHPTYLHNGNKKMAKRKKLGACECTHTHWHMHTHPEKAGNPCHRYLCETSGFMSHQVEGSSQGKGKLTNVLSRFLLTS